MANKRFVENHWSEIIQKTRNPITLADKLRSLRCIHRETYQNIKNQKTEQDQTREILDCLNSEKHFDCTYEWLKKNEAELCGELEKSDAEAAAPLNKRARLENEDETDSHFTGFPDLKVISTYPKLESWVSYPENSQKLISYLERKLGEDGMEALKKELKDKEPKNSLHFNANNIDDVRKNKELDTFPSTTKSTKIPKLTFSMFFKKSGSAPSGNKAQSSFDDDEFMDTTLDLSSSGYESLNSSFNNSWSLPSLDYLPQHSKRLLDEDALTVCSHIGDMAIISHVNKDNKSTSKTTEQLHGGSVIQIHHEGKADAPSQESMGIQDAHFDEMKAQHQSLNVSNVPRHVGVTLYQADQVTKKETPQEDGLQSVDVEDVYIDKVDEEPQRTNVPNVPRNEDVSLCQNDPITKKATPLEGGRGSMAMQVDEMDEEPQKSDVPMHEESITGKATPLEDTCGSKDMQEIHINEMKVQPQRLSVPNAPRHIGVTLHQPDQTTKKETPQEDGPHCLDSDEMDEEPQRSSVPHVPRNEDVSLCQNDPITKKATPLEDTCGSKDMQESLIDEMDEEPQSSNAPTHEDESITEKPTTVEVGLGSMVLQEIHITLHQPDQTTKKETPQEDGPQSVDTQDMHIDEMDEEPQRSSVPHVPKNEAVSLCQNDPITKKATPLEGGLGSMAMEEIQVNEMDDKLQRSNVPMHKESITQKATPLEGGRGSMAMEKIQVNEMDEEPRETDVPMQEESVTKKATPLEDKCGSKDMQEIHINEMKLQPQRLSVPNAPRHIGVTLHQPDQTTKKETPQEDGPTSLDSDEMDEEPQKSSVPHVPRNEDVSLCQNDPITKKATPQEDGPQSVNRQDMHIDEIDEEPQRTNVPNVPMKEAVSLCQNDLITEKATPLEGGLGSMGMQESHINEIDEEPQRSYVPMHEESITQKATPLEGGRGSMAMQVDELDEEPQKSDVPIHEESITEKATPLEDTCGSKDMQEIHINEMKVQPQRLSVPNAPRHIGVTLHQPDQTTKKETPQEDGPHCLNSDEMDEEPQRSSVPHVPRNEDVSLCQNDPITKKATPLEGGLGSMGMQESHINEMDEEPQRSNVPKSTVSLHQNESVVTNKIPLENKCGHMNMQQYEQANKQAIPEPFPSKQLQTNIPGSASEYTQSNGSEITVLNKVTAMLAPRDVKDQSEATKKREKAKYQNQKKKQEKTKKKDQLLRDWALRQCNGREEELKDIFDQISIINMAEHSEYPCFTAENVLVYKHLTPDSQIIFTADDNTSIKTMTMVHYHMYVCNIKKAVILGPKKPNEQEIQYNESKVPIEKCRNLISLAFAPALTVYKKIQKEEKLYSLI